MKHLLTSILIATFFFSPLFVTAQTVGQNQQILQRFQPNASVQTSGTSIGGVSFSGISGSILACANVGGKIVNAISSLFGGGSSTATSKVSKIASKFNFAKSLTGQAVPTSDANAQEKIKIANEKLEAANKKESCLDAIAYTVAKQALQQVTNKTLNWVNTGFGGNPFYVRNIDSFLGSIKNDQVRDYIRIADNINAGDGDAVGPSVTSKIIEMITGRPSSVAPAPSTANQIKYDNFTKDFSTGGWDAWYRMTQLGENPISEILTTSQQLGKNIIDQQLATKDEIANGNGFLSQKKCVQYYPYDPIKDANNSLTENGNVLRCAKYETVTPGSVIGAQVQTITNSGTRQLEAADELNEVLGAFFDSLLNKLFNKGLQTLGRDSGDTFGNSLSGFGGQGNNIVVGTNGQPINGTGSGVVLPYNQSGGGFDTSNFNISNPRHIAAVIKTQKDFLNRGLDSQASLQKIVPNLGHLDYCLPGPHPTWGSDTEQNTGSFFSTIQASGIANSSSGFFTIQPYDLFDPLKNGTHSFPNKTLVIQNDLFATGAEIAELFSAWFTSYETTVSNTFSQNALSSAFEGTESTASGKAFARGFVADAVNETSLLPDYLQSVITTDSQYETVLPETRSAITELESIRAEVLDIVTTARNRHIATKRAAGITVNLTCLNEAYDISNAPITGVAREESDATTQLDALESAQANFYNNL